ncbi:protein Daple-like [Molossus nigricans]
MEASHQLSKKGSHSSATKEVVQRDSLPARQLPSPLKSSSTEPTPSPPSSHSTEEKEHLNTELAITKAKLCLVMQELEEKTAQLRDSQHKVNLWALGMQVLKQENIQVVVLAQHVKTFSKQLDFLKKKVKHADQVEMELVRCKDERGNLDFYKAGMEELRNQNSILMEAKSMLEEQLAVARACCDQVEELQTENLQLKSKLRHLELVLQLLSARVKQMGQLQGDSVSFSHEQLLERDAGQKRMEELLEENMVLQTQQKQCMSESAHMVWELEQLSENTDLSDDLSDASRKPSVLEVKECASSHILKLEKERQSLQSTIRDASQIEKLQHELEGEKQTINDLQSFSEELFKEKEEMRSDMQMLRADSMRQIQVLEKDKDLLNQSMLLLQEASLGISEAYTKNIKEENKVLQLTVTDTSRKLSKLQFEKQILQRDMEQMQERVKQVEELKKKLYWLEKENKKLAQDFTLLTMMTTENMDALECENQGLRLENQELSKSVHTLQNMSVHLEGLEQENKQLNEENLKLRRMVETMRFTRANMAQIEMQNQELEQEEEDLEALSRKWESLELSPQNMSAENMQLRQSLDSSSQKAQALQQELLEPQAENLAQQQDLEAQQLANKQLEWSEDNKALEQEVAQLEKDKKLLEEAGKQPQQQVELEGADLDDRTTKLSIALDQEMAHCKDVATELKELEKNNRHFTKEVTTHMKRLRTLRVVSWVQATPHLPRKMDLVLEKVKSEQLNTKLDKLSQEWETRGRRQELPLQDNSSHSNVHKDVLKPQVEQGEMETVLNTECGAQQQEPRTNAIAKSENHRLQDELDRVNFLHQLLKGEREELNTHIRKLENSLHYSQLELSHQQAQFDQLKEQHQSLDNHCEIV